MGYCVDYDDGSSQYNATNNVFLYAGFKIRDGVNRTHDSNLIIEGRLADPQVAGFDSDVLSNNIAVASDGVFYSCCCSKDSFPKGVRAFGNKFFTPGNTGLPFHANSCGGADGSLARFQA